PALCVALSDESYTVRRNAAQALGAIGPPARATAPALIDALHDADARVRWAAVRALGQIDPDPSAAVPELMTLARKEPDMPTRTGAIVALGKLDAASAPAIPVLVDALKEPPRPDGDPAEAAREALQRIGPATIPALTAACEQGTPRTRAAAAQTLGDMGEAART